MFTLIQTEQFSEWLYGLRDMRAHDKVLVRMKRLAAGNFGDAKHFDGITELRIDAGPGYRIYTARQGNAVYVLLCGGDKSSQKKDIENAKEMLAAIKSQASEK